MASGHGAADAIGMSIRIRGAAHPRVRLRDIAERVGAARGGCVEPQRRDDRSGRDQQDDQQGRRAPPPARMRARGAASCETLARSGASHPAGAPAGRSSSRRLLPPPPRSAAAASDPATKSATRRASRPGRIRTKAPPPTPPPARRSSRTGIVESASRAGGGTSATGYFGAPRFYFDPESGLNPKVQFQHWPDRQWGPRVCAEGRRQRLLRRQAQGRSALDARDPGPQSAPLRPSLQRIAGATPITIPRSCAYAPGAGMHRDDRRDQFEDRSAYSYPCPSVTFVAGSRAGGGRRKTGVC